MAPSATLSAAGPESVRTVTSYRLLREDGRLEGYSVSGKSVRHELANAETSLHLLQRMLEQGDLEAEQRQWAQGQVKLLEEQVRNLQQRLDVEGEKE